MSLDLTGIGSLADLASNIIDKIWPPGADPTKKVEAIFKVRQMMEERENKVINAQKEIIVSEMKQSDKFTKRARPMVVYAGLGFIFINNVLIKLITWIAAFAGKDIPTLPDLSLPSEFWWAWTSVCGIWAVGRTIEKRGIDNDVIKFITGNK